VINIIILIEANISALSDDRYFEIIARPDGKNQRAERCAGGFNVFVLKLPNEIHYAEYGRFSARYEVFSQQEIQKAPPPRQLGDFTYTSAEI
jgi:hypothetical protein